MVRYNKLRKRPRTFLRLFGVRAEEIDFILSRVYPLWEERVLRSYKRPGRTFKLELEEMILMVLLYYRSYTTQLFVGVLFGLDESRVCRLIQRLEPLIEEVFRIPKTRTLKQEDIEQLNLFFSLIPYSLIVSIEKTFYQLDLLFVVDFLRLLFPLL